MSHFRRIFLISLILIFFTVESTQNINSGVIDNVFVAENARLNNDMILLSEFEGFEKTVNTFMSKWDLKGASVAVAREGKLLYTKGFGYADEENLEPVQPFHKFRVASVSKLVTATAIMELQEQGLLSVNDKVFGNSGILNDEFYNDPVDKRVFDITIAHLLSHEGGWTQRWGDQMFMPEVVAEQLGKPMPVTTQDIVRFALNKRLHFTPGTSKYYSNLGYSILGLIIEKVTGTTYEDYCRKNILEPLGIFDMAIGRNFPEQRAPFEVTYYEPENIPFKPAVDGSGTLLPPIYGGNDIEALGAAGAWLSTAPDMMRLLLAVDGFSSKKDILGTESIEFMTDNMNGYAPVGWRTTVINGNWWRTGTFPGTTCMIKRQPDGTSWVFLCNTSSWNGPELSNSVNTMMTRALNQVHSWPENDLFVYSLPVPLQENSLSEYKQ